MNTRVNSEQMLVYTIPVDSVYRALWLAIQTRDSILYSPPGIFLDFLREFPLISQKKGSIWCWVFTGLGNAETIIHLSVGEDW